MPFFRLVIESPGNILPYTVIGAFVTENPGPARACHGQPALHIGPVEYILDIFYDRAIFPLTLQERCFRPLMFGNILYTAPYPDNGPGIIRDHFSHTGYDPFSPVRSYNPVFFRIIPVGRHYLGEDTVMFVKICGIDMSPDFFQRQIDPVRFITKDAVCLIGPFNTVIFGIPLPAPDMGDLLCPGIQGVCFPDEMIRPFKFGNILDHAGDP